MNTNSKETIVDQQSLFLVEHVGPVLHLEADLAAPGVYVLRGPNGAGKTTTARAIAGALGGSRDGLSPTDGQESGMVSAPGVKLRVGRVRRATGTASVELIDEGPLARLIEPGVADEASARRARIAALLDILRPKVTRAVVLRLAGGDQGIAAMVSEEAPIIEVAAKVKAAAETGARAAEESARKAAAVEQAQAAIAAKAPDGPALSPKDAREQQRATREKAQAARQSAEQRARLEAQQAEIRSTLGERPDVQAAEAEVQASTERLRIATAECKRLRSLMQDAESFERTAIAARDAADKDMASVVKQAQAHDRQRAILDRPIEGATVEEAEQAQGEAEAAERALEAALIAEQAREARGRAEAAKLQREAQQAAAEGLRAIAAGVSGQQAGLLRDLGLDELEITSEGALVYTGDGKRRDFGARLSPGERARVACRIALKAARARGVQGAPILPLDTAFWCALDPAARQSVAEAAKAEGVVLLTEEPADGALRVERA